MQEMTSVDKSSSHMLYSSTHECDTAHAHRSWLPPMGAVFERAELRSTLTATDLPPPPPLATEALPLKPDAAIESADGGTPPIAFGAVSHTCIFHDSNQ
jgi:hypothetical protein